MQDSTSLRRPPPGHPKKTGILANLANRSKLRLPQGSIAEKLEKQGFIMIPVMPRHIEAARRLPRTHADPFNRLLIAQARDERMSGSPLTRLSA